MDAVNYTTFRENLKEYLDKVSESNSSYIVTRQASKPNVVVLGIDEYNELLIAKENDDYRRKIEASFTQLREGRGVKHNLIED